jgi:O-antigen/teichoic acid export membrane protein
VSAISIVNVTAARVCRLAPLLTHQLVALATPWTVLAGIAHLSKSPIDLAHAAAAQSVVLIVTALASGGMNSLPLIDRDIEKRNGLYVTVRALTQSAFSLIALAIFFFSEWSLVLGLMALGKLFDVCHETALSPLAARQSNWAFCALSVSRQFVALIAFLASYALNKSIAAAAGTAAAATVLYIVVTTRLTPSIQFAEISDARWSQVRTLLEVTLPLSAVTGISALNTYFFRIALVFIGSAPAAASYLVSTGPAVMLAFIPSAIAQYSYPNLRRSLEISPMQFVLHSRRIGVYLLLASILSLLPVLLFGDKLTQLLFSSAGRYVSEVAVSVALGICINNLAYAAAQKALFTNKTSINTIVAVIDMILNVLLGIAGYLLYGFLGLAIATIVRSILVVAVWHRFTSQIVLPVR